MKTLILVLIALMLALPAHAEETRLRLDDGMPLIITPVTDISSASAQSGQPATFRVVHRCKVDGVVLVDRETLVQGTVTKSVHSKMFGKQGMLEVSFATTKAVDGSPLRVRAQLGKKGNQAQDTASKVAKFLPYGIGLAFNGKDAILRSGVPLTIFVDENADFAIVPGQSPKRIPTGAQPPLK